MMAGKTGYDVVLHSGSTLQRFVEAEAYQKLDKAQLPNWKNLDPEILKIVTDWDPGNEYGAPYMWGTVGITYNLDMVKQRLPQRRISRASTRCSSRKTPPSSPTAASRSRQPGRRHPDGAANISARNPTPPNPEDFEAVAEAFKPIRQYIKTFDNAELSKRPSQQGAVRHQQLVGRLCDRQDPRQGSGRRDQSRLFTFPRPAPPPGSICGAFRPTRRHPATPTNSSIS